MTKRTDITRVPSSTELATELHRLDERRKRQVELASAESTRVAYAIDMKQFQAWCDERGARALPCAPEVLGLYLAHLEHVGRKPSTIARKLAAIVRYHKAGGHPSPRDAVVVEQLKGIRRGEEGRRPDPTKEAPPLTTHELAAIVKAMDEAPAEYRDLIVRDRAVLLIGWACAMRRSEIVGLDLFDVELVREGWQVWIRRSKTDKAGQGVVLALAPAERSKALCPVLALEDWLELRGTDPGPLFWKSTERVGRKPAGAPQLLAGEAMPWHQVGRLIRRWTRRAKLVAPSGQPYSPHSLRAGFITEAISQGRPIAATKDRSRHSSMDTFFKYVRIAMTFESNVQKGLL